jgi:hypothetical protein
MKYKCPLCDSPLTEEHFHKVIKIQEKKENVQRSELEKFKKQAASNKEKIKEARLKGKQDALEAKKQGAELERRKRKINDKRLSARIKKLEEENRMLQRHTSPQEIGLADENTLVVRLKREFPDDHIKHEGKGGDVLHFVIFNGDEAGRIIYECKHTDRIATDHVEQTALAKKTRQAHYGILVTTGTRKGFSGLDQQLDVFIVSQAGVLTLAHICRKSIVSMAQQKLDAAARQAVAKRLMDYVESPTCKIPLEQAISNTKQSLKILWKEIEQHKRDWKARYEIYQTVGYDISHVQHNIDRVMRGEEPLKLEKPKFQPLLLAEVNE